MKMNFTEIGYEGVALNQCTQERKKRVQTLVVGQTTKGRKL